MGEEEYMANSFGAAVNSALMEVYDSLYVYHYPPLCTIVEPTPLKEYKRDMIGFMANRMYYSNGIRPHTVKNILKALGIKGYAICSNKDTYNSVVGVFIASLRLLTSSVKDVRREIRGDGNGVME